MSTTSASTVLAPERTLAREAGDIDLARDAARADLARFVAACYYEPEAAFAEERLFEHMAEAAALVDGELRSLAVSLGETFTAQPLQELLVDYTRLFLDPVQVRARPYGSVWLSGEDQLMQPSTLAVRSLYDEAGFEIDDEFRDLPDHVAVELEFLYLLGFRENEARRAGDEAVLASVAALRWRFLGEHLGRWVAPFARAMREGAQTRFYGTLADITERLVGLEAKR
jgi:putative dimethyl sulfoxide reductase chaperone